MDEHFPATWVKNAHTFLNNALKEEWKEIFSTGRPLGRLGIVLEVSEQYVEKTKKTVTLNSDILPFLLPCELLKKK